MTCRRYSRMVHSSTKRNTRLILPFSFPRSSLCRTACPSLRSLASYPFAYLFHAVLTSPAATLTHTFLYYHKTIWNQARRSMKEQPDIHARLMSKYSQVPEWWYAVIFGGSPSSPPRIKTSLTHVHVLAKSPCSPSVSLSLKSGTQTCQCGLSRLRWCVSHRHSNISFSRRLLS